MNNLSIGELKKEYHQKEINFYRLKDPKERMKCFEEQQEIIKLIQEKEIEIAYNIAITLKDEGMTVNKAISILEKSKEIILDSPFSIIHQD